MIQKFNTKDLNNFKKYFNIKEKPGEWDEIYFKKAKFYLKFLKNFPGLRLAGVGNSTSMNYGNKNSDIDLFLVFEENTMWFGRIFFTIFFSILGLRKTGKKHAGRFCLSFFATEKGLDFSSFKIENDIYLYFWIVYFKPIININNTYEKFVEANKSWADFSEFENIIEENKNFIIYNKKNKKTPLKNIISIYDNIFKNIFLSKTLKSYNDLGKPYGIIINDNLLKFHNNDKRKEISDKIIKNNS